MGQDLKVEDLAVGAGSRAQRGSRVTVHYDGYLHRGDQFQQDQTASFTLGKREVFAGLERGVEGMAVGGKRRLTVGPHLAFGAAGVPGVVPPNALLVLEVELLRVE